MKEAAARIKINKLLENAGWRFFADAKGPANIQLEPSVTLKTQNLDALGENFEKAGKGFIDFLLLNEKSFPFIVLEAKAEDKSPLVGKEQARKYARSQNCRFVIHPDWPMVPLGEICALGGTITTDVNLALPYFGADSIESNSGKLLKTETAKSQRVNGPVYEFNGERLLYSKIRPYLNKLTVVVLRGYCSSDMYPLLPDKKKVLITYLATFMLSDTFNERIRGYYERASIPKINRSQLFEVEIPLPPLATQRAIVAEIEAEQALVASNRELITHFEQ